MVNFTKTLKDEIQRLARREIKAAISGLRKDNAALKHGAADLKRRLAAVEAVNKRLTAMAQEAQPKTESMDGQDKTRITAKMIRAIRDRLGLSQNAFAKLVGVSSQAIIQWEHKDGRLKFRGDTKQRIVGIRKLGKREVKAKLAELK